MACNEDGTFKSYDDLKALYGNKGITPDREHESIFRSICQFYSSKLRLLGQRCVSF